MLFREEFYLNVPVHEAWNFFTDFPSPILVIPGASEVQEVKPNCYTGVAVVHIGPFAFKFRGNMNVTRIDNARQEVDLEGGAADNLIGGHFKAKAKTRTTAAGANRTRVTIEVEVGLGGMLGKFGLFILRPKARSVVQHYAELVTTEIVRRRKASAVVANQPLIKKAVPAIASA